MQNKVCQPPPLNFLHSLMLYSNILLSSRYTGGSACGGDELHRKLHLYQSFDCEGVEVDCAAVVVSGRAIRERLRVHSIRNSLGKDSLVYSQLIQHSQTYGYEHLFTLGQPSPQIFVSLVIYSIFVWYSNLEKVGLLKKRERKAAFPILREKLRLIVEDVNEREPNDISYVFSGYVIYFEINSLYLSI